MPPRNRIAVMERLEKSDLPNPSTLASKPPQNPVDNPPPPTRPTHTRNPSSNNYTTALAEARGKADASASTASENPTEAGQGGSAKGEEEEKGGQEAGDVESPTSAAASWRPSFNRQQSWSQQDYRRMRQERLMGSVDAKGGYSEGEGQKE